MRSSDGASPVLAGFFSYDPRCPVVCMDEQPVQLLKETRTPMPATAEHGRRVDYADERAGTANIFMFTEPLAGWREAMVRESQNQDRLGRGPGVPFERDVTRTARG
jgi:hypothetical protein